MPAQGIARSSIGSPRSRLKQVRALSLVDQSQSQPSNLLQSTINQTFQINLNAGRPSPSKWSLERLIRLSERPSYRPARDRFRNLLPHEKNNSPMTMEDKGMLLTDLDLVNSLRIPSGADFLSQTSASLKSKLASVRQGSRGTENTGASGFSSTIPNPPSFFEEDMEKWKNKFAKHIQD